MDKLHSMERSGSTYYYVTDAGGTVQGLVNSTQTVVTKFKPWVWGGRYVEQESVVQPFGFQGRPMDRETGMYNFRARWYDPKLMRFISEDPIGLAGGINPYLFAGNDPINGRDPSGTTTCTFNTQGQLMKCVFDALIAIGREAAGRDPSIVGAESMGLLADPFYISHGDNPGPTMVQNHRWYDEENVANAGRSIKTWNQCVSSTANENFRETQAGLATLGGRIAGFAIKGAAGSQARALTNSTGLVESITSWWGSSVGGQRVFIGEAFGQLYAGRAGAAAAAGAQIAASVAITLAFDTGIALGSTGVGLSACW